MGEGLHRQQVGRDRALARAQLVEGTGLFWLSGAGRYCWIVVGRQCSPGTCKAAPQGAHRHAQMQPSCAAQRRSCVTIQACPPPPSPPGQEAHRADQRAARERQVPAGGGAGRQRDSLRRPGGGGQASGGVCGGGGRGGRRLLRRGGSQEEGPQGCGAALRSLPACLDNLIQALTYRIHQGPHPTHHVPHPPPPGTPPSWCSAPPTSSSTASPPSWQGT